jgi:hypothetical protein
VAAYGYASFLAYVADRYQIDIARLWVTSSNLDSWAAVLDNQLKRKGTALSSAFTEFAQLWLVDHSGWGSGWGELGGKMDTLLYQPHFDFARQRLRRTSAEVSVEPLHYLSGGALGVRWSGAPGQGATIAGELTHPGGYGWIGLMGGDSVNGQQGKPLPPLTGVIPAGAVAKLSFELGPAKSALDPKGARVTYWNWGTRAAGVLQFDLWAIPQLLELKVTESASKQKTLSWAPSALEAQKDLFKEYLVELRDAASKPVHSDTSPRAELDLPADKLGRAAEACARVRDTEGNLGPEACISLAVGDLEGRWRWISRLGKLGGKEIAMEYWFDFERPLPDGTVKRCTKLIGQVGDSSPRRVTYPPSCRQMQWQLGGRGFVLSEGRWRADCALRRTDRLRLDCLVDEAFGSGTVHVTATAEKQ